MKIFMAILGIIFGGLQIADSTKSLIDELRREEEESTNESEDDN